MRPSGTHRPKFALKQKSRSSYMLYKYVIIILILICYIFYACQTLALQTGRRRGRLPLPGRRRFAKWASKALPLSPRRLMALRASSEDAKTPLYRRWKSRELIAFSMILAGSLVTEKNRGRTQKASTRKPKRKSETNGRCVLAIRCFFSLHPLLQAIAIAKQLVASLFHFRLFKPSFRSLLSVAIVVASYTACKYCMYA